MSTLLKYGLIGLLVAFIILNFPSIAGTVIGILGALTALGVILIALGAGALAIPLALAIGAIAILGTVGFPFLILGLLVCLVLAPVVLMIKAVC